MSTPAASEDGSYTSSERFEVTISVTPTDSWKPCPEYHYNVTSTVTDHPLIGHLQDTLTAGVDIRREIMIASSRGYDSEIEQEAFGRWIPELGERLGHTVTVRFDSREANTGAKPGQSLTKAQEKIRDEASKGWAAVDEKFQRGSIGAIHNSWPQVGGETAKKSSRVTNFSSSKGVKLSFGVLQPKDLLFATYAYTVNSRAGSSAEDPFIPYLCNRLSGATLCQCVTLATYSKEGYSLREEWEWFNQYVKGLEKRFPDKIDVGKMGPKDKEGRQKGEPFPEGSEAQMFVDRQNDLRSWARSLEGTDDALPGLWAAHLRAYLGDEQTK